MTANKFPKNFWADVLAIEELTYTLENVSNDLKQPMEKFTVADVIEEAEYVLSCFYEPGHINNAALMGDDDGEYTQAWARKEVRKLKALIRKYKTGPTAYSHHLNYMAAGQFVVEA